MTDHWSRPESARADESLAIEVPLTGSGGAPAPTPTGDGGSGVGRRALVATAVVVAAIIAVMVAVQVVSGDDDDEPTSPTVTVDELAALITTPPTLAPLDTLPSPDDPALEPLDDGPQPTTSQDRALFDSVTLPSYPVVTDVGLPDLVAYDIAGAVARLDDDVPRRSETRLELGTSGFVLDVTIERDPDRDRYFIRLESQGDSQEATVDVASGTTYVRSDGDVVADIPNGEILAGSTATDINEYFDRLLLGPVRPDSFDAPATRGRAVVTIDDVRLARQFIANVRGSLVPEWQLYAFSPVFEFPVEDRPSSLEYAVYVDDRGDIVQVDGLSLVGDVPQLVMHRIVRPDEPLAIDLPPDVERTGDGAPPTTLAAGDG